jgi:hypothetical protein
MWSTKKVNVPITINKPAYIYRSLLAPSPPPCPQNLIKSLPDLRVLLVPRSASGDGGRRGQIGMMPNWWNLFYIEDFLSFLLPVKLTPSFYIHLCIFYSIFLCLPCPPPSSLFISQLFWRRGQSQSQEEMRKNWGCKAFCYLFAPARWGESKAQTKGNPSIDLPR